MKKIHGKLCVTRVGNRNVNVPEILTVHDQNEGLCGVKKNK